MRPLRSIDVIDTRLASGLKNHALDRRHLASIAARACGDILRFHRSTPTVSLGAHQERSREARVDYCAAHQIEIARRLSGGGALYLDPGQLGMSLVLRRPKGWRGAGLERLLARFTRAIAQGLRALGVAARAGGLNDVEVNGRKIASAYVAAHGDALLLQATLLLRADVPTMLRALRMPTEKLSPDGLAAARDRVTSLDECLGRRVEHDELKAALVNSLNETLSLRFRPGCERPERCATDLDDLAAEAAAAQAIDWVGDGDAVEGLVRTPGGTLRARARFEPDGKRFAHVELAADTHFEPASLLAGLQDVLRGLPVALLDACVGHYLRRHAAQTPGWNVADLLVLLRQVADKQAFRVRNGFSAAEVNALTPHTAGSTLGLEDILAQAAVVLVPYCAKPSWCKWRNRDGCTECGLCEVGEAYRLARSRNMRVTTIVNYEHLVATLKTLENARVPAYVGMCCRHFFVKRHRAFTAAGLPAVLMDVGGANCYELGEEAQAYAGAFQAQSRLDAGLLGKVMKFVPPCARHGPEPAP